MTVLAVVLALGAAMVFGVAAVNQHHGVRRTLDHHREQHGSRRRHRQLRVGHIATLVADAGWRRGFLLMTLGTACHIAALSLAPISLTQPINVLAVPTTILAGALLAHRRPAGRMLLAAGAVVVGVGSFVVLLSGSSAGDIPTPGLLGWIGAAVLIITVGLHLIARRLLHAAHHGPSWLAPVLLSVAGALCFGTTSSTFRLLAQDVSHAQPLPIAVLIALVCYVPVGLVAGAWSIQQAYAAGAAPAVTATSALTDPVVALVIGMAVLGETPDLAEWQLVTLVAAAALAVVGVSYLTRHDDEVDPGRADPAPVVRSQDHRRPLLLQQIGTTHAHPARR